MTTSRTLMAPRCVKRQRGGVFQGGWWRVREVTCPKSRLSGPTTSRGRTVLSRFRACSADRNRLAPPGSNSSSSVCSRLMMSVRRDPGRRDGPPAAATPPWCHRRHRISADQDLVCRCRRSRRPGDGLTGPCGVPTEGPGAAAFATVARARGARHHRATDNCHPCAADPISREGHGQCAVLRTAISPGILGCGEGVDVRTVRPHASARGPVD
jgi:hypothetical protein